MALTATWSDSYPRTPTAYAPGPPPLSPLAVAVANTTGQWLFAVVSWRQDAGTTGVLQYPSTVTVSDDAENFWIPVKGVPAQSGIVRTAVWMAPAARAAEYVFISPNAYQSSLTVLIAEFTADCPWYSVAALASGSTNQGTSVTASVDPGVSGLFAIGVITHDNGAVTPTATNSGWTTFTALPTVGTSNGSDHSGDLGQFAWYGTTGSGTCTIGASNTGGNDDYGEVIIVVHGVTDLIAFPYAIPAVESWPVLITEIASGPVINANPVMVNGTTDWSIDNGTLASVTWPVYQPWPNYQALITPTLSATPGGSSTFMTVISEQEPVTLSVQYTCVAYVYSVAGYNEVIPQIIWYNSGGSQIGFSSGTTYSVPGGAWTQVTFPVPVFPVAGAVFGAAAVAENAPTGDVPSSAVLYIGYCGFGPADAYEDIPADEIAWTDISSRNFTQDAINIARGIQYEQQSLEAGTMTVTLVNNDGAMMFGNILSAFWPTIGDTDVPIRLRAVWPYSVTPYYVLFSGYTDDIDFNWDSGTRYGYATVEASDAWSRLTSQMLTADQQEVLEDNPVMYCTCSQSGTNIAVGGTVPVQASAGIVGPGTASQSFTSSQIQLQGAPGVSCWQVQGLTSSAGGFTGYALTWFPPSGSALPPVAGGVTVEFWMQPVSASAAQPTLDLTVCTCYGQSHGPAWTVTINNTAGSGSSTASITVYDRITGAATTTSIGGNTFLGTITAAENWFFGISFTQTSLTVTVNPGFNNPESVTVSCNLAAEISGFSWGGNAGPLTANNIGFSPGLMNAAFYGIAVFGAAVPPARLAAHCVTAATANPSELDSSRLARVAGYAGATPAVLAMRCLDLPTPPGADLDIVTAATDTSGQVTSDYFTNIAASTLAAMFVPGTGVMMYRRRLEWYDRTAGQWTVGELSATPLGNTLNTSSSLTGWQAQNGATLTSASEPAAGPLFVPFSGLFHGNGSTANPQISYGAAGSGATQAVTPGLWYTASAVIYSPQGWATGVVLQVNWLTSGGSFISQVNTATTPVAAGSLLFLQIPASQVPQTGASAQVLAFASGTPASTVQFYVADVIFALVQTTTAGGAGSTAAEVPYLVDVKLSSDRALLYNQAQLTQYGTNTATTFSGTDLNFSPTSGVLVVIENVASVTLRAGVPYTATLYTNNTAQATPYYLNEPSMEDFGNWITQTLAAPLMRPEAVTITPAATAQAMTMALQAEVGDTATFRRRPLGAPEIQIVTYISKVGHEIDFGSGRWNTKYELSPFPQGNVLVCDDVIHGTLTGGNYLGW